MRRGYPTASPAIGWAEQDPRAWRTAALGALRVLVRELGSEVVLEPQELPQYPPPYYATFWRDPHGFVLEAVCHHDRD